jgi:hypothetical protein
MRRVTKAQKTQPLLRVTLVREDRFLVAKPEKKISQLRAVLVEATRRKLEAERI